MVPLARRNGCGTSNSNMGEDTVLGHRLYGGQVASHSSASN